MIETFLKKIFLKPKTWEIPVYWHKISKKSKLRAIIPEKFFEFSASSQSRRIEAIASKTNKLGNFTLWSGYVSGARGNLRQPDEVRTPLSYGIFYKNLVEKIQPENIVEIGTAFGVSGMFFLAGIRENKKGKLFTFEPNTDWANIAKQNLSKISDQFVLINSTFEEKINLIFERGKSIDIAFIDGIHTKEFVFFQVELILERMNETGIIILDDINFSDEMQECWKSLREATFVISSLAVGPRVGVLEISKTQNKED